MNMLERCAALLSAAQADPTRRRALYDRAHPEMRRIVLNTAQRRIRNPELVDDAVQNVSVRVWRRVVEKPGPVSPVELRMLIDGTISNTLRDDTRARKRNGEPMSSADDMGKKARHALDRLSVGDPTMDRAALLERMRLHADQRDAA